MPEIEGVAFNQGGVNVTAVDASLNSTRLLNCEDRKKTILPCI